MSPTNSKSTTKPPARPKYSNQAFSAWKAYLGDDEEPDQSFIDWKKNVLGESSCTVNTEGIEQKRKQESAGGRQGGENKAKEEGRLNGEDKASAKSKEKRSAVLGGRENMRVV